MSTTAYVWTVAEGVTSNYHNSGGVLIVTDRDPRDDWREYAKEVNAKRGPYGDPLDPDALDAAPDHTFPAERDGRLVVVFPDAGCC